MVRDVLIASMNKGQLPVALMGIIAILMILKMPGADVSRLVFDVLAKLENGALVGYAAALLSFGGWFFHAKFQRRIFNEEMERVAQERNELQARLLRRPVKSSN